jgi:hypothetical protein
MAGEVRYVGMTTRGMKRPMSHLRNSLGEDTHKARWIRSLVARGLEYEISVLEEVEDADLLPILESQWIECFRSVGARLTNETDGGDGVLNPGRETREKIKRSLDARKEEIGEATRKRWSDPEYRKRVSASIRASWTREGAKEDQRIKLLKCYKDPGLHKKISDSAKKSWENKEVRENRITGMAGSQDREQGRIRTSKRWKDPVYIKKVSDGVKAAWKKRKEREIGVGR